MKIPLIIGAAALVIGVASIPGIKAVIDTAGPKFSKDPQVEVGFFTYSHSGCKAIFTAEENLRAGEYYAEIFENPLVNNSGVTVGAGADLRKDMIEVIKNNNALNRGRGGAIIKTAEDGTEYVTYEQIDIPGVPRYVIYGDINMKCCNKSGSEQSIIITTKVIDRATGSVVANSRVAGTGVREQNFKMLGPKPSLWERFISGYVREVVYDDLLDDMLKQSAMETAAGLLKFDPQTSNGTEPQSNVSYKTTYKKDICGDPLSSFKKIDTVSIKDTNPKPSEKDNIPKISSDNSSGPKDKNPTPPPVLPENQAQDSFDCNIFRGSWFPTVNAYEDGCGGFEQSVAINGVSFTASFGFITEVMSGWDEWVVSDGSISSGMSLGQNNSDGEFTILPLGSYGVKSVRMPISYDDEGNKYQWVYAKYYVRYNKCETDLLITGTGSANDLSYGKKVTDAAETKIKENVDKMKGLLICKP